MNILLLCLTGMVLANNDHLLFSFRSQYDGYVMPYWKNKKCCNGDFFEDAVVVTPKTIVLGDGLGGAKGLSGVYSHFQCLKLTNFLLDSTEVNAEELLKNVNRQTILNNFDLNVLTNFEENVHHKDKGLFTQKYRDRVIRAFKLECLPKNFASYKAAYEKNYNIYFEEAKKKVDEDSLDITDKSEKAPILLKTEEDFKETLSCLRNNHDKFDMATTLVYLKLEDNKLVTGVAGDSSYLIFRLDEERGQMGLVFVSPETVQGFNKPHSVSETGISGSKVETHEVQEGDIVLVASDGVLDVLPISFLTAATNFLVQKMVDAHRNKNLDPNFDYTYDLAGFMESYVDNLAQLTLHSKAFLEKKKLEKYLKENIEYLEALKSKVKPETENKDKKFTEISWTEKEIEKVNEKILNLEKEIAAYGNLDIFTMKAETKDPAEKPNTSNLQGARNDFSDSGENPNELKQKLIELEETESEPSYLQSYAKPSNEEIEVTMKSIYGQEICNTFDPTDDSRIFRDVKAEKMKVASTRKGYTGDENGYTSVNCFEEKNSVKETNFGFDSDNTWKCDSLEKLNGSTSLENNKFYSFDECVSSSTPRLEKGITKTDIALSFNSRYFARNIGLTAKFMSTDKREKIDEYTRKFYEGREKTFFGDDYRAKKDDIAIAAAALTYEKKFDQINLFNEVPQGNGAISENDFLKQQFDAHAEALKKMINTSETKPDQGSQILI